MKRSLLAKNKLAIIIKNPDGVQYCCVQCPVRCGDKEQLEKHLFVHNNVYRHLCGICGTGLKRKEHLDRHLLEHQQVRPHVCDICSKAFKRKEHLNIHKSIHSGDKSEVCMLCHKSFYRKDHLQKHLQTHTKMFLEHKLAMSDQVIGVKAEVMEVDVSERFDDSSQEQDAEIEDIQITPDQHHLSVDMSQPQNEERPYACHLCSKTYKRKDHLKLHSQTHMKKDKICSECGRGFATDEKLLQHMNMHLHAYSLLNSDEDKTHLHALLTEHNIDTTFLQTDPDSLLVPRHSVPSDRGERRHECEICHRKFKRRQHLIVHMNVHLKHQPSIWCSHCNQGFTSNDLFETHNCVPPSEDAIQAYIDIKIEDSVAVEELNIKISNPPADAKKENEWPHSVEIIPLEKQEDSTQYLIQDESLIPSPMRVYVCKFCQKPFKRKDHYKIHTHIHTGIKSFFCTDCGKGFYRKDHLQKHSQVHSKAKTKPKKALPGLFPIKILPKKTDVNSTRKEVKPEITIHAPSNTKLRVPLQIKVPYQMVMSMDNGEQRAVTIDPQACSDNIL